VEDSGRLARTAEDMVSYEEEKENKDKGIGDTRLKYVGDDD